MAPVEQTVWDLAIPVAESLDLRLVRVQLGGGATPVLQIMLEPVAATPKNRVSITLDQCEAFSREFAVMMDVEDPIPEAYQLEVSSTGLERPLVHLEDFIAYAPHRIKARTKVAVAGQKRFTGMLESVQDGVLFLKLENQVELVELPFEEVAHAALAYTAAEERAFIAKLSKESA